jgi:hypothetical protein
LVDLGLRAKALQMQVSRINAGTNFALWAIAVLLFFGWVSVSAEVSPGANTSSIGEKAQLENAAATIAELTEDVRAYQPQLPDLGGWDVYNTWQMIGFAPRQAR